jgi:predicted nucleic acid-binding protein
MEHEIPVDASTLIYLAKARAFREAFMVVGRGLVPNAVWEEAVESGQRKGLSDPAVISAALEEGMLRRVDLTPSQRTRASRIAAGTGLGRGECQVIALGRRGHRVLIDDVRASRVAASLGHIPLSTVLLPVLGVREKRLESRVAIDFLRRVARVVTLSADVLARLEAQLEV